VTLKISGTETGDKDINSEDEKEGRISGEALL
jgi:hypothetical protein